MYTTNGKLIQNVILFLNRFTKVSNPDLYFCFPFSSTVRRVKTWFSSSIAFQCCIGVH